MNDIQEQEDLLNDIQLELQQEAATTGQRFANYIVDLLVFYILLVGGAFFFALVLPGFADFAATWEEVPSIMSRIVGMAIYGGYMGVLEGLLKGRSFGKFITRTKAIEDGGTELSFSRAMLRGLSRIVPFEAFSAIGGYPWHDKWTGTRVVRIARA